MKERGRATEREKERESGKRLSDQKTLSFLAHAHY